MPYPTLFRLLAPFQRLPHRPAEDELVNKDSHGPRDRFAHDGLSQPGDQPSEKRGDVCFLILAEPHESPGQHQCPGRGVHEEGVAAPQMRRPIGGRDLVMDQAIGGLGIRNTKQGFRQAKQRYAFRTRKPVGLKERF